MGDTIGEPWKTNHVGPIYQVQWNPKYKQVATACEMLYLWG